MQRKSDDLLSNAEKVAAKLAKEARQKEIDENVKKLTTKKLEFKSKNMGERKKSFHGKIVKPLFEGYDVDFWQEQVGIAPVKGRPGSGKLERTGVNREITFGKRKVASKSPGGSSDESDGKDQKPTLDKDAQLQSLNPSMADPT